VSDINEILKKIWGYPEFRPLQKDIIQSVLSGKDTLALLPTGGGKSICFQVPALALPGICIVISPLIALMKDQVEQLKKRGIPSVAIYSGMSRKEIDVALDNAVYGGIKFLYVSPERLKTELFIERAKKMKVSLLAIDEAHCISQWGYDFRPSYLNIADLRKLLPKVPVIALTATATEHVKKDIQDKLEFKNPNVFQKSFARPNLSYSVFHMEDKEKKIIEVLKNVKGSSVVYLRSRKKTQEIALLLNKNKISADYYHAGLDMKDRSQKQDLWISGRIRVIVATNAFGMGIDKPDVRTVIHWEVPDSLEAYYQEAGRAGRDEKKAYAVLLYNEKDLKLLDQRIEETYPSVEFIRKVYQALANYYKIAVGSSNLASYDFDIDEFERVYKLPKVETYYALKRLEKEGFVQMNEGFYQPSRLLFLMHQKDLYEFQIANEKYDLFIKTILRMYGGELFSSFCIVSENQIGRNVNMHHHQVVDMLRGLEKLEVLEYQQQNDKPQLVFTTPRIDASKLPINVRDMEERKKSDLEKVRSVTGYATQNKRCRTLVLLDYFGEVSDEECGVCDVCLKKKKEKSKEDQFSLLRKSILSELEKSPKNFDDLILQIPASTREEVLEVLRQMLDAGEVSMNDKGTIFLISGN